MKNKGYLKHETCQEELDKVVQSRHYYKCTFVFINELSISGINISNREVAHAQHFNNFTVALKAKNHLNQI